MEKRFFLAISLSLLVLVIWAKIAQKNSPSQPEKSTIATIITPKQAEVPPVENLVTDENVSDAVSTLQISSKTTELSFIEAKSAIKEVTFLNYQAYKFLLEYGLLIKDNNLIFKKVYSPNGELIFVHSDPLKVITKRFVLSDNGYELSLNIEYKNISQSAFNFRLPLVLGVFDSSQDQMQTRFQEVVVGEKEKTLRTSPRKEKSFDKVRFLAMRDKYFCAVIEPEKDIFSAYIRSLSQKSSEIGLLSSEITLSPGQETSFNFHIYMGPQDLKTLQAINQSWAVIMNFGTFDFIGQILLQILEILFKIAHNWGLAIIILSFLIYFLLYPLSIKQMRSMKQMQELQPEIERLRQMYKDNPQRLNKETIELYKKNKANPFGGCLVLVLQIPIFFALYQTLMRSVALKGAKFLWINDLSEPDRLILLSANLPIIGNEINILPVLMAIGMFMQQKLSMATAKGGSSAEQQKIMMIIFPLIFFYIFYKMPSGLVLYWFINSTLMLIYQFRIMSKK